MTQEFEGPISNSNFSGRDVNNNMTCSGIEHCPHLIDEARRQKDFKDKTGIRDCPRGVRETFLHLMDKHNFTSEQIRSAWNSRVLNHDNGVVKLELN
jgi:hypothetical protein